jgi:hypothetical protein
MLGAVDICSAYQCGAQATFCMTHKVRLIWMGSVSYCSWKAYRRLPEKAPDHFSSLRVALGLLLRPMSRHCTATAK